MTEPHDVSVLFKALSAPIRVAIIRELAESGQLCVHDLVDRLDASQSLVSQHLRVLKAADLVRGTRRGKEMVYEIADTHVSQIVADALSHVREETP